MKNIKLKILIPFIIFALFSMTNLKAQNYKNAIGLRAGSYSGITYKQFINSKNAFELYGLVRFYKYYNFSNITAVYQIHNDIPNAPNLKWYYGFGGTLGFYGYKTNFNGNKIDGVNIGILGTIGLEFSPKEVPFCFALDWSPTYFINHGVGFYGDYAHFAARYILGR